MNNLSVLRHILIAILISAAFHVVLIIFLVFLKMPFVMPPLNVTWKSAPLQTRPLVIRKLPPAKKIHIATGAALQEQASKNKKNMTNPKIKTMDNFGDTTPPSFSVPEISASTPASSLPQRPTPSKASPYTQNAAATDTAFTAMKTGLTTGGVDSNEEGYPLIKDGYDNNFTALGKIHPTKKIGSGLGGKSTLLNFSEISKGLKSPSSLLKPGYGEPSMIRLPSDILFDFDSSKIRFSALIILNQAKNIILEYKNSLIEISGHTDTFGSSAYNMKLSKARAEAVKKWILGNINKQHHLTIDALGLGEERSVISPKGSKKEQEANRRVEILIYPQLEN